MASEQADLFSPRPRAVFSSCTEAHVCPGECLGRKYRYELEWPTGAPGTGSALDLALFVMANPSTATHLKPDPTVTRCIGYARTWGYARAGIANVRAWRETHPELMPAGDLAIGPDNDAHILSMASRAGIIVCGWGKLGGPRGLDVLALLRQAGHVPHALMLNADRSPQHPLYLAKRLQPFPI